MSTTFAVSTVGNTHYFTPATGATIAVSLWNAGALTVLVQNAAHRAYKRSGRTFHAATRREQLAQARAAYKSASVQAALDLLEQEVCQ